MNMLTIHLPIIGCPKAKNRKKLPATFFGFRKVWLVSLWRNYRQGDGSWEVETGKMQKNPFKRLWLKQLKNRGKTPKMDGENKGKPYVVLELMIWGYHYFWKHPVLSETWPWIYIMSKIKTRPQAGVGMGTSSWSKDVLVLGCLIYIYIYVYVFFVHPSQPIGSITNMV